MDAFKCDRCGKLYEGYHKDKTKQERINPVTGLFVSNSMKFLVQNTNGTISGGRYYDLCKDCMNDLIAFMDIPKEVTND